MDFTVILCTHNRCESLTTALESIAASTLPSSVEWEVVVVDNNSSDRTRDVVEDFCARYPGCFRYLFESQQGLSYARNAGIREARGKILAFTDDDLTVEPTWLLNLTAGLHDTAWAGVGGRILPLHAFSCPRWLSLKGPYSMGGILTLFDLGDQPRELRKEVPYGANMAFRKEMFEKYGGFRTDLGRRPGSMMSNEDTEFGRRLLARGERLRYEPTAVVHHAVPENRLKQEYFLAFWFNYGRALVLEGDKRPDVWEIPKVIGQALPMILRWMKACDPQLRFYRKCWVWVMAGRAVEIYRQAVRARTPGGQCHAPGKWNPQSANVVAADSPLDIRRSCETECLSKDESV